MTEYYEFLAMKVSQPFSDYYACMIPSDVLKKISFSLEAENNNGNIEGVQRLLNKKRLLEIANFINSDSASFPNSIILGANFLKSGRYTDEDNKCEVEKTNLDNIYKLKVPKGIQILSIIDGQHRLYAFDYADAPMDLLCSVYLDLAMPYQAFLFSTINYNQGKVDKSLAYQLFGYELESKEPISWPPETLAVYLSRIFNNEKPLEGRIKYRTADEKRNPDRSDKTIKWKISTAAIVESILSLISKNPKDDRYLMNSKKFSESNEIYGRIVLLDDPEYPLRSLYIKGNDKAIKQLISMALTITDDVFWKTIDDDNFLKKTVGFACIFKFLKAVLLKHGVSKSAMNDNFKSYMEKIRGIEDFSNAEIYPASTRGMNEAYKKMIEISGIDRK